MLQGLDFDSGTPVDAGRQIRGDYARNLRLAIDAGASTMPPEAQPYHTGKSRSGYNLVGTGSVSPSGPGWLGSTSTSVTCNTPSTSGDELLQLPANSDFTAQFVVDNFGGSTGYPCFFRSGSTSLSNNLMLTNETRRPFIRVNGSDILRPGSGPQWTDGQKINYIIRFRNALTIEAWWDGALKHSASHSASLPDITGIEAVYKLLVSGGGDEVRGNVSAIRVWSRWLHDGEVEELADDPGALYEPQSIWVPVSAANAYTLSITQGSYTLTGNDAQLAAARRLAITQGSYSLTGNNAGLAAGRRLAVTQGSYALTGNDLQLAAARQLSITQGAYSLTGNNAGLAAGRSLAITQGAYTLTGNAVQLAAARQLAITQGSYALTGNDVTLTKSAAGGLQITQGAYTLTGNAVQFAAARRLAIAQGSYTLTGQSVGLSRARAALQVTQGTYTLTVQDVLLRASLRLSITTGLYALTGNAVTLLASSAGVVVRAALSPARLRLGSAGSARSGALPTGRRPT